MKVALRVVGRVESRRIEELTALHAWLLKDHTLRGAAQVSAGGPAESGHMGEALELLNVVLSNAIALASLTTSIVAWRGTRPAPPSVTIEANGSTVTVDTTDPEAVRALVDALRDPGAAGQG